VGSLTSHNPTGLPGRTQKAEWNPFHTHYFSENVVVLGIELGTSGSVARTLTNRPQRGILLNVSYTMKCGTYCRGFGSTILAVESQEAAHFCCVSDADDNETLGFFFLTTTGAEATSALTRENSDNSSLHSWLHR
jgi:hypothetical protein